MLNLAPQHDDVGIYQPRNPKASGYYRCVQDHFEQLEMHWQDRYAPRYSFWRPYVAYRCRIITAVPIILEPAVPGQVKHFFFSTGPGIVWSANKEFFEPL